VDSNSNGEWRMADGGWRTENGGRPPFDPFREIDGRKKAPAFRRGEVMI
jgi:hypothetical protein